MATNGINDLYAASRTNPNGCYLSENGNIVTTESTSAISVLEIWERICHGKNFGVLRDDLFEIPSQDVINNLPANVICAICLQRLRGCAFRECGHLIVCRECQQFFTACPVCGKKIKSFISTLWNTKFG